MFILWERRGGEGYFPELKWKQPPGGQRNCKFLLSSSALETQKQNHERVEINK